MNPRPFDLSPAHVLSARAHAAERTAEQAADQPWSRTLMRIGYVARGAIYLLPGVLAFRLATGHHGAALTPTGAIRYLGNRPFGQGWLMAMAVGLAGYALWGIVRAIFDPLREGHQAHGVVKRAGYLSSALAYAGLLVVTLRYLAGARVHAATPQDWTARLLAMPFGPWLVALVGVCWIAGGGISQIASGWNATFVETLDLGRMSATARTWAIRFGRVGTVARGVVFTIIGMFLIGAALHHSAHEARGMDGALLSLEHEPFGRLLLATVALGLVCFGLFSMMCAGWVRVRVRDTARSAPAPSPSRGGAP